MIYDFSFEEVMRLSSIKRWGIIEMSRQQSVAEHSYNVAMISGAIVDFLPEEVMDNKSKELARKRVVNWALYHDLPEVMTGDIPTPVKSSGLNQAIQKVEKFHFPDFCHFRSYGLDFLTKSVVKIADYIDAIQFAEKFCVDTRKISIIEEMRRNLEEVLAEVEKKEDIPIAQAVENIYQ